MATHARKADFSNKLKRIREFLKNEKLDAVVLSSQMLFAWATSGGDNYVVTASEGGVAYLFVSQKNAVVLTNKIEAGRILNEEVAEIGLDVWSGDWFTDGLIETEILRRVGKGRWKSDSGIAGSSRLGEEFLALTYQLTPYEIEQYRALGKDCSEAMEVALDQVAPGMTEHSVAGEICKTLWDFGVRPHLALAAADERAFTVRHPIPKNKKFKKHLMAVLCGKRGGLIVNVTRLIHAAKKLPSDLERKHAAVCAIDMAFNAATTVGTPLKEVFVAGVNEYKKQGFANEWTLHHQGGPTGYQGRSYLGKPTEKRAVLLNQAFAWNPSIAGTKSEDTILVGKNGYEFLSTPSAEWPKIKVAIGSTTVERAGIKLI